MKDSSEETSSSSKKVSSSSSNSSHTILNILGGQSHTHQQPLSCKLTDQQYKSQITHSLRRLYPFVDESKTPLPTCWNTRDKYQLLHITHKNTRVHYTGQGKSHKDAAAVRANHPIPPACGIYYFEVRIINKGRDGLFGIGLSQASVNLNRLPGWDRFSYGYHGDDGNSFSYSGSGLPYGPTFSTGDVIGCGLNFVDNNCFYTKNGLNIGVAFTDLPSNLYPTVGLQTPGEIVHANFGQTPFVYDIYEELKIVQARIRSTILMFPLSINKTEVLNALVSSYLVHHGYSATADSFSKMTNQTVSEDAESIQHREKILKLIKNGKISDAIHLVQQYYPGLLERHKNLMFMLKCRQFVEMVAGHDEFHPTTMPNIARKIDSPSGYDSNLHQHFHSQHNHHHSHHQQQQQQQQQHHCVSSPTRSTGPNCAACPTKQYNANQPPRTSPRESPRSSPRSPSRSTMAAAAAASNGAAATAGAASSSSTTTVLSSPRKFSLSFAATAAGGSSSSSATPSVSRHKSASPSVNLIGAGAGAAAVSNNNNNNNTNNGAAAAAVDLVASRLHSPPSDVSFFSNGCAKNSNLPNDSVDQGHYIIDNGCRSRATNNLSGPFCTATQSDDNKGDFGTNNNNNNIADEQKNGGGGKKAPLGIEDDDQTTPTTNADDDHHLPSMDSSLSNTMTSDCNNGTTTTAAAADKNGFHDNNSSSSCLLFDGGRQQQQDGGCPRPTVVDDDDDDKMNGAPSQEDHNNAFGSRPSNKSADCDDAMDGLECNGASKTRMVDDVLDEDMDTSDYDDVITTSNAPVTAIDKNIALVHFGRELHQLSVQLFAKPPSSYKDKELFGHTPAAAAATTTPSSSLSISSAPQDSSRSVTSHFTPSTRGPPPPAAEPSSSSSTTTTFDGPYRLIFKYTDSNENGLPPPSEQQAADANAARSRSSSSANVNDLVKKYANCKELKMMQEAFSLMAYSDPWKSPVGYQLGVEQREPVAAAVNSLILESGGYPAKPPLEIIVAHAQRLRDEMAKASLGVTACTDPMFYILP